MFEQPIGCTAVKGIRQSDIKLVTMLSTGAEVLPQLSWNSERYSEDYVFIPMGENPVFTYPLPDEKDTVIKIELK